MPEFSDYIEGLNTAGALTGAEIIGVSQSGSARKITTADVAALASGIAAIPTAWNFATSGASPGDYPADLTKRYFTIDDSIYPYGTEFWTNGSGGWYTK